MADELKKLKAELHLLEFAIELAMSKDGEEYEDCEQSLQSSETDHPTHSNTFLGSS